MSLLTDEVVGRTYMVPENIDRCMAERIFLRYRSLSAAPDRYVRVICAGEEAVGVIHDVGIQNGTVELGWALLSGYHSKGYCTEAVCLAIGELRDLSFRTVTAGAFAENTASLRVMEKNGMKRTDLREMISYKGKEHLCVYCAIDLEETQDG